MAVEKFSGRHNPFPEEIPDLRRKGEKESLALGRSPCGRWKREFPV